MAIEKAKNDIVIDVRFSYVQVWEPRLAKGSTKLKYSASLLWAKTDKATTEIVKAAFVAGVEMGKEKKFKNKNARIDIKKVIHDGDAERGGNIEYKGMWFLSAKSDNPPGVGKFQHGKLVAIIDKTEFYSGCFGKANVSLYPFNNEQSGDGIAVGLNHVAKTKEGEKLGGGPGSLEDAFGEVPNDGLGLDDGLGLGDDDDIM